MKKFKILLKNIKIKIWNNWFQQDPIWNLSLKFPRKLLEKTIIYISLYYRESRDVAISRWRKSKSFQLVLIILGGIVLFAALVVFLIVLEFMLLETHNLWYMTKIMITGISTLISERVVTQQFKTVLIFIYYALISNLTLVLLLNIFKEIIIYLDQSKNLKALETLWNEFLVLKIQFDEKDLKLFQEFSTTENDVFKNWELTNQILNYFVPISKKLEQMQKKLIQFRESVKMYQNRPEYLDKICKKWAELGFSPELFKNYPDCLEDIDKISSHMDTNIESLQEIMYFLYTYQNEMDWAMDSEIWGP